jgi:predicted  nucleic acid-binding Zn-ribbon protein
MQNIEYLKDRDAVLVPLEQWEKLQSELAKLKKRVKKSEILTDLKKSLAELETDLRDESYDAEKEISAADFIAKLKDEQ